VIINRRIPCRLGRHGDSEVPHTSMLKCTFTTILIALAHHHHTGSFYSLGLSATEAQSPDVTTLGNLQDTYMYASDYNSSQLQRSSRRPNVAVNVLTVDVSVLQGDLEGV
jgi:hypothetical protein